MGFCSINIGELHLVHLDFSPYFLNFTNCCGNGSHLRGTVANLLAPLPHRIVQRKLIGNLYYNRADGKFDPAFKAVCAAEALHHAKVETSSLFVVAN